MSKANKVVGRLVLLGTVALGLPVLISATPDQKALQELSETDSFSDTSTNSEFDTPLSLFHTSNGNIFSKNFGDADQFRFLHNMAPDATIYIQKKLSVKRGNTLMELLVDAGLERLQAYYVIEAMAKTTSPKRIRAGQDIYLTFEKQVFNNARAPQLVEMTMPLEFGKELVVKFDGNSGYYSGLNELPTTSLRMYAKGVIENSLYLSAMAEGVPLPVVTEMILLFSFDVDFQREIWAGDKFELFYERRLTNAGEAEEGGKILAASLILRGKPMTFYRFETEDGKVEFYNAEGKSAKRMLMKTPVDGARLTSYYGNRKHPILGYTRMHKGVDFGARRGTPIMAAGDGVVERASPWGSYGNYLRIRHNGTYKTAYGHMTGYAKGIKAGVRVRQGQIIGYVGATGGATGPHLHYEILMNGNQVNPLTLKLPKGESLKADNMGLFNSRRMLVEAQKTAILAFYDTVRLAEDEATQKTTGSQ